MDSEAPIQPAINPKENAFLNNYDSSPRLRRSANISNEDSSAKLFEEVVATLRNYFFTDSKASNARSSYNDIEDRISKIMTQLGEPKFLSMLSLQILLFQNIMMNINSTNRHHISRFIYQIYHISRVSKKPNKNVNSIFSNQNLVI